QARPPVLPQASNKLRVASTTNLSLPGAWRCATTIGNEIVAAGVLENRVVLRRCDFQGNVSGFASPWSTSVTRSNAQLVLCAAPGVENRLGVYVLDEAGLAPKIAFGASDVFAEPITVGALPGVEHPYGIARGMHRQVYSIESRETAIIKVTDERGDLVSTC